MVEPEKEKQQHIDGEEGFRESEERFRKVFEEGPIGMAITAMDFRFIRVNARLAQMLGYTEEELTKLTFPDITYPEDIDKDVGLATKLFNGEIPFFHMEKRYIKKNGEVFWVSLTASLIRDEEGNPLYGLGMIEDINERKRAEERLRLFSEAVEKAPDGFQITDLNGRIIYSNKAIEKIYGFTPEEYMGRHVDEMNADPEYASKVILPSIRKTGGWTGELMVKHKNGSIFPIWLTTSMIMDDKGNPIALVGIIRDITERKRIERALTESEERYRTLFESATDAAFILDIEGERPGKILAANQEAADMHGYSIEELLTLHINDLDTPETAQGTPARVKRLLAGERIRFEGEHTKRDGTVFSIEVIASVVEFGGHKYVLALDRDITESKTAKKLSDALNEINTAISSTLDVDDIMRKVVVESAKAIGAETAAIELREAGGWLVRYVYNLPQELIGRQSTGEKAEISILASRLGRPVAINDTYTDERIDRTLMEKYKIRSFLAVPLIVKSDAVGTIIFNYPEPYTFTATQIDFATKLGVSVSLALENARLYEAERNIADTLQEALLIMPEQIEGVSYGHLYRSSTETARIGGDFYDIFELEHGKVGIVIGDVSGKGI
ncbi:MAG TPA: PAS domain S-box protein, partial [Anaerolineae bacterium]|nr:PAS domain S-box protein [Anaerolineae bacterium]